ncbi:GH25 family lysozyme [Liquorilactobacillus vini]|uniref:GH25 family lysozyme n=1 Tax=Liquorilactobacillus vini TaxID=238015 RepID=UPI0002DC6BAA|nr:GH25 family lysozyme [Liquorilactobacillus vini]
MKHKKIVLGATAFAAAFLFATSANASSYTKGVDVANYQDSTQEYFANLKSLGATFSIVKLGGSGGGEGTHYQNPKASAQLANGAKAGLNVAGYFWGQFGADQASAKHMASLAVSDAQKFGLKQGSTIALDYEAGASSDKEANTAAIKVFMQAVKDANYKPALYSGAYYMKTNVNIDEIGQAFGTCLWIASYKTLNSQTEPDFNYFPSMKYVAMWQYGDCWYNLSIDADADLVGFISSGGVKTSTPVKPTQAQNSNNTAKTYVVKSGDSWWKIANTVGLDMYQLAELNGKTISSVIHPGDVLKINGTLKNNVSKSAAKNNSKAKMNAKSSSSSNQLVVDGYLGYKTILRSQQVYGMRVQDGVLSVPRSSMVKIWQKHLGVTQDGILGRNTINAMEHKAGLKHTDGKLSSPSYTVKYMQRQLNKGLKPF